MDKRACERRLLASNAFCAVEMCACGAIHLTIGAVTLRLTPEAFPSLAEVIGDGARELALGQVMAAHRADRLEAMS